MLAFAILKVNYQIGITQECFVEHRIGGEFRIHLPEPRSWLLSADVGLDSAVAFLQRDDRRRLMTRCALKAHNFESGTKGTGQKSFLIWVSVNIRSLANGKTQFLSGENRKDLLVHCHRKQQISCTICSSRAKYLQTVHYRVVPSVGEPTNHKGV